MTTTDEKQQVALTIVNQLAGANNGMALQIMRRPCETCIYRKDSPLDLAKLENDVRDDYVGFKGYRICHHHDEAVCRGFWSRHRDKFQLGQIAQRLGMVVEVDAKE